MAKQASAISAEFEKALGASKAAVKRFNESKKAQPSTGFQYPDIPSGASVYCRITASADKTKDGTPRVRFRNTVVTGEFKGKSWYKDYYLDNDDQQAWDRLSADMQMIAEITQDEMDDWGDDWLGQMCGVLEEINKNAPCVRVGVTRKMAAAKKGKDGKEMPAKEFFNTYYNELMNEDDLDLDDDAKDSAPKTAAGGNGSRTRGKAAAPAEEPEPEGELTWEEVGTLAEGGDEEAQQQLLDAAAEIDADFDTDSVTWEELGAWVNENDNTDFEGRAGAHADEGDEPAADEIEKGMFVWYKPPRHRSDIECKVSSSNKAKKVATLKQVDGDGEWAGVEWDKLEICEEQEAG